MLKINFSYDIDSDNFVIMCSGGDSHWQKENIRNLLAKNDLAIEEKNDLEASFTFKILKSKFIKDKQYIDVMNAIFRKGNEIIPDKYGAIFIEKIEQVLRDEDQNNALIYESFFSTIKGKENKILKIEYKDILKIIPFDFQIEQALKLINRKRLANFSSPGSGKTLTAMLAVIHEYQKNKVKNLVVFGPKSASNAWTNKEDFRDFFTNYEQIRLLDFSSSYNKQQLKFIIDNPFNDTLNILFVNYHKLQINNLWFEKLTKIFEKGCGLIVDECHYFKNQHSQKFKRLVKLSKSANYVYFLSGTPLPHSIEEGFYITRGLWPVQEYSKIDDHIPFSEVIEDYKNNFKKIYVRTKKDDHIKPLHQEIIQIDQNIVEKYVDKIFWENFPNELDQGFANQIYRAILIRRMQAASSPHSLKLSFEAAYDEIYEDAITTKGENFKWEETNNAINKYEQSEIEELESSDSIFQIKSDWNNKIEKRINKLLLDSETKKILEKYQEEQDPRILETINLLQKLANKRVLIWNVFRKSSSSLAKILKEQFKDRTIVQIDGRIKSSVRDDEIKRIRQSQNGILIASPATIAESISLHREIDHAIYFFRNYVGSHWMQSIDRIHRLVGKDETSREKFIYILESKGSAEIKSIDYYIGQNLNKKTKLQAKILD